MVATQLSMLSGQGYRVVITRYGVPGRAPIGCPLYLISADLLSVLSPPLPDILLTLMQGLQVVGVNYFLFCPLACRL